MSHKGSHCARLPVGAARSVSADLMQLQDMKMSSYSRLAPSVASHWATACMLRSRLGLLCTLGILLQVKNHCTYGMQKNPS